MTATTQRPRVRVLVDCVDCRRHRPHQGRGLCDSCYACRARKGTLTEFPRTIRTRAEVLEDWEFLSAEGLDRNAAAERMGMTRAALDRAIQRAARDGVAA